MTAADGRLENTTTCLPIAYGSVAFYLGKKADEYHTHRWTLYVRSPDQNFDLSRAISKVIFQLHPSFPKPTRELTEPPFEVTETGWGEFEASIRIVWSEAADERSTILTHGIRLYPNKAPATSADPSAYMNTTVPVVAEKYDEVVFTNPKAEFHRSLVDGQNKMQPNQISNEQSVLEHFRTYGDEEDAKAMLGAKAFLEGELRNVKDRLLLVDSELDEVKHSLAAAKKMEMAAGVGETAAAIAGGRPTGGSTKGGGSGITGGSGKAGKSKSSKKKASGASESSQPAGKKIKAA
eukprot:CAMPEP_0172311468 /NCGR_PEP_ID=MMETSP1058-20130122/14759_1 /TAXON_ID=83371 /ORGANISM="Detonula confervacea, Strain CCMP 353" /LENGTH=292 /DNA_ID=CAMNT_0013024641 /DNA_START=13 /DNA_END=891 /DNA_ORIENTATION=+